MRDLTKNIRFWILLISLSFSLIVYFFVQFTIPSGSIQTIKLTQIYALAALFFLYVTLLATPLTRYFKMLPFRGEYIKSRRALGVSAFYFGLLHGSLAFFFQLGGFSGLGFLSDRYLIAISLSFVALFIMTVMAATAFDKAIEKLGFSRWKAIHRLIYLAGILVLVHAVMLGTHFSSLSKSIPKIVFTATFFLLMLESKRFDDYLGEKFRLPSFGLTGLIVFGISVFFLISNVYSSSGGSLGIHSQHILQAQKDSSSGIMYGVSLFPQENFVPGKKAGLKFKVFNESTGELIKEFDLNQEKIMHLVIIGENFDYFDHVHPDLNNGVFSIDYVFPKYGKYRIYADFMPKGSGEQYRAFQVNVGNTDAKPKFDLVFAESSSSGDLTAKIILPKNVSAKRLSEGKDFIGVRITDKKGNEVKNIGTYLGAFGHLVMINSQTYEYVHVHPKQTYTPIEGETTGPLVEFSPLGIYGNIKPGVYKFYSQFNIDNKLVVFEHFVKINQ